MSQNQKLTVSALAHACGVSSRTIRYYLSLKLINFTSRTIGGWMLFSPKTIKKVNKIKSLQKNKFYPLAYIKKLMREGKIRV